RKPTQRQLLRALAAGVRVFDSYISLSWRYILAKMMLFRPATKMIVVKGDARPSCRPTLAEMVERFRRRLKILRRAYDTVSPWWVNPTPPEFEPRAGSALEGVLWLAEQMEAQIVVADANPVITAVLVSLYGPFPLDIEPRVSGALRQEGRAMLDGLGRATRLPMYKRLTPSEGIARECFAGVRDRLPDDWERMSSVEKL